MKGLVVETGIFEWNSKKEKENIDKHGVSFVEAKQVFLDPKRLIAIDEAHSRDEERFFCIGKVNERVLTVRFTYRKETIRIIGAGYWRKGKRFYEEENRQKKIR